MSRCHRDPLRSLMNKVQYHFQRDFPEQNRKALNYLIFSPSFFCLFVYLLVCLFVVVYTLHIVV